MFSQLQAEKQAKSQIQSKRQTMHKNRVMEEREKIKKSIRFSNMSQQLMVKHQSRAQFIRQLPVDEAYQTLYQLLETSDLITLSCCIIQLHHRPFISDQLTTILPRSFMQNLVQATQQMIYQPQVIAIYKCLTGWSNEFHEVLFEHPQVIRNIVKEIRMMKGGHAQQVYLEVLEDVCPSYSKRWQQDTERLFNDIFQMLQNQTIAFLPGLNILKSLSAFINSQISFSPSIIHRLLEQYQSHKHTRDSREDDDLLQGIFLVLTKVIYYTENTDIVSSWRMVQVVVHAEQILKQKVIHGYYNCQLLLAKLVEKISKYEMCQLSYNKTKDLICKLIQEYRVQYLDTSREKPLYEITTMLINHLLNQTSILQLKQFTPSYLYLMVMITRHCHHPLLMEHFIKHDFLDFLVQSVDHVNLQICGLALELLLSLMDSTTDMSQTAQKILSYCNLKNVLQTKLYNQDNKAIVRDITLILEKLDQFAPEY